MSDFSVAGGPTDPWGVGREGALDGSAAEPLVATTGAGSGAVPTEHDEPLAGAAPGDSAAWLSADASSVWSPGQPPRRVTPQPGWGDDLAASDANWTRPETDLPDAPLSPVAPGESSWSGFRKDDPNVYELREPERGAPLSAAQWQDDPDPDEDEAEPDWTARDAARWDDAGWRQPQSLHAEPKPASSEWDGEQSSETPDDDAPTAAAESLSSAFAPWREEGEWQRPRFPRYGPPRDTPTDGRD